MYKVTLERLKPLKDCGLPVAKVDQLRLMSDIDTVSLRGELARVGQW